MDRNFFSCARDRARVVLTVVAIDARVRSIGRVRSHARRARPRVTIDQSIHRAFTREFSRARRFVLSRARTRVHRVVRRDAIG
jgi:hypothetical protein